MYNFRATFRTRRAQSSYAMQLYRRGDVVYSLKRNVKFNAKGKKKLKATHKGRVLQAGLIILGGSQ